MLTGPQIQRYVTVDPLNGNNWYTDFNSDGKRDFPTGLKTIAGKKYNWYSIVGFIRKIIIGT